MFCDFRLMLRWCVSVFMFVGVIVMSGCEKNSDSHIWDGHDFGENNPNLYVVVGDSITAGYGLDKIEDSYPSRLSVMLGKRVVNHGVSGSLSSYGAAQVDSVLTAYKPGYLLILYGVNDLINSRDIGGVLDNLRRMAAAAKANKTIPVIATLTPVFDWYSVIEFQVSALNAGIKILGAEEGVHVVDLDRAFNRNAIYMSSDGLHPNSLGQELMALTFYETLR